jgi:Fe-S cluster assembly ATP-binding protein
MLTIRQLSVSVEGKKVIKTLAMDVVIGEAHVIMGANGSGKSSLASTLLGDSRYEVTPTSHVQFDGKNLLAMTSDERMRAGLFVAWQSPIVIPGVSVFNLCRASYSAMGNGIETLVSFKHTLETLAERVGLTKEHITRSVNEGFSGGERKRLELLQLLLLQPKLAILDEIDSGLDARGISLVIEIIQEMKRAGTSFIIITHNKRLLENVAVDRHWEMQHGHLSAGI